MKKINQYLNYDLEDINYLLENPSEIETGDELNHEEVENYHLRLLKVAKLIKENEITK